MVRSFQSLELFEDTTVFENLSVPPTPRTHVVLPRPGVAGDPQVRAAGGAGDRGVRARPGPPPRGQRPVVRQAAPAGHRPRGGHAPERAAARRAGGRPESVESVELARVVRRLADDWGMAILVVEHDMNFVMGVCDRVVVLDFGRMIANGTPDQVRNDPAVIAAYLGVETDESRHRSAERTPVTTAGGDSDRHRRPRHVESAEHQPVRGHPHAEPARDAQAQGGYLGREVVSGSTSPCSPARSCACSARTAPARPPRCSRSPANWRPSTAS